MSGKGNSIVGSLINGLGTNALAGNDVRKGLLINAALLAGSGGLSGLGSAATQVAGTGSALTGPTASTAANTAFMNAAGVNPAIAATTGPSGAIGVEAAKTGLFSGAMPATNTAMQGQGLAQTTAIQRPLSLTMPGVEPGQGYEYTMGDRLAEVGQFAQQNPALVAMAAQTGQGLLQKPNPPRTQSAGLLRGNPSQVQAPQYQVGIPQVTLI